MPSRTQCRDRVWRIFFVAVLSLVTIVAWEGLKSLYKAPLEAPILRGRGRVSSVRLSDEGVLEVRLPSQLAECSKGIPDVNKDPTSYSICMLSDSALELILTR